MLLLTDRGADGYKLQNALSTVMPCTLASLHHQSLDDHAYCLVVCDVALESVMAVDILRASLARASLSPNTPVVFLLRDPSHLAKAQAKAAGATVTLPFPDAFTHLCDLVRSLIAPGGTPSKKAGSSARLAEGVKATATLLGDMLDPTPKTPLVSGKALNQAGSALLTAVGDAGIGAWLDMVWTYDDVTYQHCLMVAGLVAAFALELGLPAGSKNLLSQAALVHDIGKAQIPRAILNKAGPLTPQERHVMCSHPARGHAMLAKQGDIDPVIMDVVRHHHELLDGSGYPDALQAHQISRPVRMITICDIYAALTERRPYKKQMPASAAMAYLESLGPRLDRPLLNAFRNVVRES